MDRSRLKNIIILILFLVNVFLLGSMAYRGTASRAAHDRAVEQLVELFAADGVTLEPGAVSSETPPAACVLTRDTALERSAAAYLLGGKLSHSERGGAYGYAGSNGAALFRENGGFEAAGTLAASDGEEFCRRFCREFRYGALSAQLDGNGSGTMTALREYGGLVVSNCAVTFTLEEGAVVAAKGTLLPEASAEAGGADLLSAQAALTAFQSMRRETGAVVSSITEMYLCYELQSSTAAPMSLAPAWCIVTDTVNYYVNCVTGAIGSY